MINRRSLMLGAAAVAIAPVSATALPARLLDLVPCDGRVLPISQYFDLFEVLRPAEVLHNAFAFRVPDMRGRVLPADAVECDQWTVFPHIVARHGREMPIGSMLLVVRERTTVTETLAYLDAMEREQRALRQRHIAALVRELPHG